MHPLKASDILRQTLAPLLFLILSHHSLFPFHVQWRDVLGLVRYAFAFLNQTEVLFLVTHPLCAHVCVCSDPIPARRELFCSVSFVCTCFLTFTLCLFLTLCLIAFVLEEKHLLHLCRCLHLLLQTSSEWTPIQRLIRGKDSL